MLTNLLGALSALAAALLYGGGDFTGGYASQRRDPFQVLVLSALAGVMVLLIFSVLRGESLPTVENLFWASLGGVAGALGLAALYHGLAVGSAAVIAPTSGVLAAAIPVVFDSLFAGLPEIQKLVGFLLAFAGIWLVTRTNSNSDRSSSSGFLFGLLAGLAIGVLFIFISKIESISTFTPLVMLKIATLVIALVFLYFRSTRIPGLRGNSIALLAGALDAGATAFYLLATRLTSLGIAAVLSSLYPAVTVILAKLILRQEVNQTQWIGVVICLAAIVLIVL